MILHILTLTNNLFAFLLINKQAFLSAGITIQSSLNRLQNPAKCNSCHKVTIFLITKSLIRSVEWFLELWKGHFILWHGSYVHRNHSLVRGDHSLARGHGSPVRGIILLIRGNVLSLDEVILLSVGTILLTIGAAPRFVASFFHSSTSLFCLKKPLLRLELSFRAFEESLPRAGESSSRVWEPFQRTQKSCPWPGEPFSRTRESLPWSWEPCPWMKYPFHEPGSHVHEQNIHSTNRESLSMERIAVPRSSESFYLLYNLVLFYKNRTFKKFIIEIPKGGKNVS